MTSSDINQMLAEKGNPCVSILMPTHRLSKDRSQDPLVLHNAVLKGKALLHKSAWPKDQIVQIEKKIDETLDKIDYLRFQESIGIFISPNIAKVMLLPFAVKEKITLSNTFEIRNVFYCSQFLGTYYLLAISKKKVRLFKGEGLDIVEIVNDSFPRKYAETYEYARPSLASSTSNSTQSFEHDKSEMEKIRQRSFLKAADKDIDTYLKNNTTPLVVAGVTEELSRFKEITHHSHQIKVTIEGNYDFDAVHVLAQNTWKKLYENMKDYHQSMIARLREKIGERMAVDGILNVWKMATEGNGLTLLVEKDFELIAYTYPGDSTKIYLSPLPGKHNVLLNIVDHLVEMVKEKGGEIIIVENGELDDFEHVALFLRHSF